jgi:peptide/nickel transport system ATP-binding protein
VFHTRCPRKLGAICEQQDPPFADAGEGNAATPSAHRIRCHIPVDELRALQTASRGEAGKVTGKVPDKGSENAPENAGRNE